jgi:sterol desaturase/sphingolipid hydroxylase (fatty acid hydroxylase superfamily)
MTQGLFLYLLIYFTSKLNKHVILLWAFLYASVHNINYLYVKPQTHENHHKNEYSSYGLDIWDIALGTNIDTKIEDYNHMAINLILLTLVITYFL